MHSVAEHHSIALSTRQHESACVDSPVPVMDAMQLSMKLRGIFSISPILINTPAPPCTLQQTESQSVILYYMLFNMR